MYHSARCLSVVRVYAFQRRKLDVIRDQSPSRDPAVSSDHRQ
jgi:hypothetical protein